MTARPRTSSIGNMFKKKQTTSYQVWVDEEDGLLGEEHTPARPLNSPDSALEEGGRLDVGVDAVDLGHGFSLVECFYLGAHDMEGRSIRGRGCIDSPAGELWEQTQEDHGRKRRRSVSRATGVATKTGGAAGSGGDGGGGSNREASKPRYVKLVAVKDELEMRDVYTDEKIASFRYCQISFVGTHPKYSRLFAFVAHERGNKTPSCYAFKCEDKLSACSTAQQLDSVFHQRCTELKNTQHPSSPTGSVVTVP